MVHSLKFRFGICGLPKSFSLKTCIEGRMTRTIKNEMCQLTDLHNSYQGNRRCERFAFLAVRSLLPTLFLLFDICAMAETTKHPTQEAGVSTAECDIEQLKTWYQEYTAAEPSTHQTAFPSRAQTIEDIPEQIMGRYVKPVRKLCPDKAQEVDSDPLDAVYIQAQIQLSMSDVSISQDLCRSCSFLCNNWPDHQVRL